MLEVGAEYLEATLGLVKRLEISKELICERVTVPGCKSFDGLMQLCMQKYITISQRGGPLTPP